MHGSEKRLRFVFFLNLFFSIIEIIGGFFTNSMALLSDAIHDFGDSLATGIAWILEKKAGKKPDKIYTYGYKRYSLLGALITSIVLFIGSAIILIESVNRILNPQIIKIEILLIFAVFGVLINGFAVLKVVKGKSVNEKVITLHLFEDALGWIALLIGALFMYFFKLLWIDTVISIIIAIAIIFFAYSHFSKIVKILMEKVPLDFDIDKLKKKLKMKDIIDIYHVHLWSLDGKTTLITLHIVIKDGLSAEKMILIKDTIRIKLMDMKINHATIEIEVGHRNSFCIE